MSSATREAWLTGFALVVAFVVASWALTALTDFNETLLDELGNDQTKPERVRLVQPNPRAPVLHWIDPATGCRYLRSRAPYSGFSIRYRADGSPWCPGAEPGS